MAARSRKILHDEQTRAKIQAAMIINRLQDCIAGKITLDSVQVSAAKTLLAKTLPDLSSVALAGDHEGGAMKVELVTIYEEKPGA